MKRITQLATAFFIGLVSARAQTSSCSDVVAYVSSKNVGAVGNFHLSIGHEEKAAQTYHYSGPGKVNRIRVYGSVESSVGVPLRVHIYTVDLLGRPKQELSFTDAVFWSSDNSQGYISVNLPSGGTFIDQDFAVGVTVRNSWPYGTEFKLSYTGDGEGHGHDLASVSGTSTGNNWTSALDNFDKDGDFYLVPEMTHFLTPEIEAASHCLAVGVPIQFENQSAFTQDSMFNRILGSDYNGSAHLFTWNFGDGSVNSNLATPSHSYSTAGSYTATLSIAVDGWSGTCTNEFQFPVSVGLSALVSNTLNPTCFGENNGSITAAASGGATPYEYSIDGYHFQDVNSFGSLMPGVDTLIVRDAIGCRNTSIFIVQQPARILLNSISTTNANCGASDGSILIAASGGTGTLLYKLNNGTFQPSGSFTNLAGGSYNLTVKDANGCSDVSRVVVNNFGSPSLTLASKTNVSCNGLADGTIQVTASGGTGIHQFSIDGGASFQSSGSFTGLSAGTYSVLVRDASGCSQGIIVNLNQALPISFDASVTSNSCAGIADAQLTVHSATGGIGSFSYSIGSSTYQTSSSFSGLASGVYSVHVKDAAGCVSSRSYTIQSPTPVLASAIPTPAACNAQSSGSLLISASGGSGPYEFSLNGQNFQSLPSYTGLPAGVYTYAVRDNRSCTAQNSVTITQPSPITAIISSTSATCGVNNGGVQAVASGGSGGAYSYSLDGLSFNTTGNFVALNAGTYFVTVKDAASCKRVFTESVADANGPVIQASGSTNVGCHGGHDGTISVNSVSGGTGVLSYSINGQSWSSNSSFLGLASGDYTVFVKDVNGCIGTSNVSIDEPDPFVINKVVTDVTCHDGMNGAISVYAAGGSGTLAYSIDNGATYQSSNVFSGLISGLYAVSVRDVAGCIGSATVSIHEPTLITFNAGFLNVTCHGDSNGLISVNASGGTGNYQYSLGGSSFSSENDFTGLSGGLYAVYVRDANNCNVIHFVNIHEPDSLELHANIFNVSCAGGNNGAIDITATGGTGNKSYLWSNDSTSQDLFNLTSGNYILEVRDQHGCSTTQSFEINEPQFPLVVNAVVTGTDGNSGSIDATVTGGTEPYAFEWSNTTNTEDLDSLSPGNYTLTVTDASGCVSNGQFTVQNTAGINSMADASDSFKLYPNPASNFVHVEWNEKLIGQLEIEDIKGRKVYESRINQSKTDLDVSLFEEGIYFVRVFSKNETAISRFIVVK
jgi:hypothetical protein